MTDPMYLTDQQVADHFGIHRTTVWRWAVSRPNFPQPKKLGPGVTRFLLRDVEAFEAEFAAA